MHDAHEVVRPSVEPSVDAHPAVENIERLVQHAFDIGATDLHFEPGEDSIEVRIRSNGTLMPLELLPKSLGTSLVGRIKTLSELLVYRKDIPQEGWIRSGHGNMPCDLRVATYPTLNGERIALRLGWGKNSPRILDDIGLDPAVCKSLKRAFDHVDGVILMSGPSGSGKTTTLYSCLHYLASQSQIRTMVTIEDPIERRIPGVIQTQVNPHVGLSFDRALRSILRQDPEVILVGEIRDRETAATALEAGLTGHLVATTVHAGTAPKVFSRLLEMGVEPFVITTAVRGVVAQRLLRRKCDEPGCADPKVICSRCNGLGYRGSVLIAEWLPMTDALREVVLARGDGALLHRAAETCAGYVPLRAAAEKCVAEGLTTAEEVERVLGWE